MYWFKNVMVYRLSKKLDWSSQALDAALPHQAFFPCGSHDQSRFGWAPPLNGSDLLHFSVNGQILLLAQKEEKILPAAVIKQALEQRIESVEEKEQRKLSKVEKQTLKDDVINELLPRAFSKKQQTALWIDADNDLVYVNAASAKRAEDTLALLRKSLGSLPVVPLVFANDPATVMTDWIANDNLPQWLTALGEAELTSTTDESVIRCKQQDLASDEMQNHFAAAKQITKLALEWEEHLSFIFAQDCSLKRLKFADTVREKNDDILKEDYAQRFDADFILMSGILAQLSERLLEAFGGEAGSLADKI
ncbi:recombination-associated protein RdgC [Testudinibacter aquarius]|uniref:Recombination-associated protein RdgC n=1 Tax=Testudinibacter aquarius TaxID=1524974 RepID=A0A4R3XVD7_9PAST|nr:recombination-associated protein RdgC [Testudinibacter aquarius]KAE9526452.1 recombination-associated protein RdgC [Testudinibacter aquarius]TCV83695.1 recombination associated protein RdgC [Testudinibacter aquarius]TNG93189.1 recombination-associated protein RdgC [Testudinibacter aquarius]